MALLIYEGQSLFQFIKKENIARVIVSLRLSEMSV